MLTAERAEALKTALRCEEERRLALEHPANLLCFTKCVDSKTGEVFEFDLLDPDWEMQSEHVLHWENKTHATRWSWQRLLIEAWIDNPYWIGLKARQLGVTWLAAGYILWTALAKPGTTCLVISVNEQEASQVVNRIWEMYLSLPEHLKMGVKVLKPSGSARPFCDIIFEHPDGRISNIRGLPATKAAGHGQTVAVRLLDEFAHQAYAADIWEGAIPTGADKPEGTTTIVISTANGVSNETTGEGNFFHHLWINADHYGIVSHFLSWRLNPARTEEWHRALPMKPSQKAEQYPEDPDEAFILTGDVFFDVEALDWYRKNATVREPLFHGVFETKRREATFAKGRSKNSRIEVYRPPEKGRKYAIAADSATGRGLDYSCAYVIDLGSGHLCAELHGKLPADEYAEQLYWLGLWYNTARIAPEMGGGYGEPVVIGLRTPVDGRPGYRSIYRHRMEDRPDEPESANYGFPMTAKTRPLVLSELEKWIREKEIPEMPSGLLTECLTFVYAKTNPSPRAQDGCNDDRVMAAAIAYELFRQFGSHEHKPKRKRRKQKKPYPWM